jgi:putative ABC transport system permease protein
MREFGIRKALGASTGRLIRMVSRDVVVMIVIGSALAMPVAFILTRNWLDNFAFRTTVSPVLYVLAVAAVPVAALATIAAQSLKSAAAAPVDLLDRD